MGDKTFDWYKSILELGNFEVEHGRIRFFETAKLHLAVVAGILALSAYAVAHSNPVPLLLALILAVFGAVNASAWNRQLASSFSWDARWRLTVSAIEDAEDFRSTVGVSEIKAWSHDEVKPRLSPGQKKAGATAAFYGDFVFSLRVLYIVLAVAAAVGAAVSFWQIPVR